MKLRNCTRLLARSHGTTPDVLIIGGGIHGSAVAYFIARRKPDASIIILEPDPTYQWSSTPRAAGGIRQQFSTPACVQMSLFGAEFIKSISSHLGTATNPEVDIGFKERGYLLLSTTKGNYQTLLENSKLQQSLGAKNVVLNPDNLKERYPWLNCDDLTGGCIGTENEGWYDPHLFLQAFRTKVVDMGVEYRKASCTGLNIQRKTITSVELSDGTTVYPQHVVCTAGSKAAHVAIMAGLDIPIRPKKRNVFVFRLQGNDKTIHQTSPLIVDATGAYFRPESSGQFITGICPPEHEDLDAFDLEVQWDMWDDLWAKLAHRVPAFEAIKPSNAWAGFYEYNILDQNGLLGYHTAVDNLVFSAGYSGHGLQHAPAAGRAISELIVDGKFTTIDCSVFSPMRFEDGKPIVEKNVY